MNPSAPLLRNISLLSLTLTLAAALPAAVPAAWAQTNADGLGQMLTADAAVKTALAQVQANEPKLLEEQVRLCEIPAPPFKEQKRAEVYRDIFKSLGLRNVRIDAIGNVLGERPGKAEKPHLVFAAHLDTVFPEETNVKVTREGNVLKGPGIGDDCRGLAVVLGVIRALDAGKVQTPGTITFVGNVGEEGLGDLRGVKHLFNTELKGKIDRFVSVDGTGYGITHIGVGSKRYRVTFKGPGGHSYGAFGRVNPIHALGRAIDALSEFQVPAEPKTTFNVGRIGGGTSVNSIPFEAWMEVDMRSIDAKSLAEVDAKFRKALDDALEAEKKRWGKADLTVDPKVVGDRPAGRTPADAPIVQAAASVTKALGLPLTLDEGSTDANVGMNLNIPAITIDGGGKGTDAHALTESFDSTDSWKGTQRALLVAIALAQP
jgi:acetylornithine deacetylase/succinyl-diaminopimelate desuccinylase-like protein